MKNNKKALILAALFACIHTGSMRAAITIDALKPVSTENENNRFVSTLIGNAATSTVEVTLPNLITVGIITSSGGVSAGPVGNVVT